MKLLFIPGASLHVLSTWYFSTHFKWGMLCRQMVCLCSGTLCPSPYGNHVWARRKNWQPFKQF